MSNMRSRIPVLCCPQTFTFKRQKVVTTTKTTTKSIQSSKSTAAQTTYRFISQDLLSELEEQALALGRAVTELESVSGKKREPEDSSVRWQTINLVLHSFAPFVWFHIPDADKEELGRYGMNSFLEVHYTKWGKPCPARDVARRIYDTIHSDLRYLAEHMITAKRDASKRRDPLARPDIPDAAVREFLKVDLEDGIPDLTPMEIAAFEHIKLTANSDANIQEANRDL